MGLLSLIPQVLTLGLSTLKQSNSEEMAVINNANSTPEAVVIAQKVALAKVPSRVARRLIALAITYVYLVCVTANIWGQAIPGFDVDAAQMVVDDLHTPFMAVIATYFTMSEGILGKVGGFLGSLKGGK